MITLMERKKRHMQSFVKQTLFLALIVLGAIGAWAQTNNTIDLATVTANTIVQDGETLTGTLDVANYPVKISIADGATVTLDDVTIIGEDNDSYPWGGITCEGVATLILVGTNTLSGFEEHYPGIYVPENCILTLQGTGSLNAIGKSASAGIGGGNNANCGNIVIAGGFITATGGGVGAPGIGAGYGASCGTISISGGTVTAQGGNYAAGIGAGYYNSSCVSIDITGGTVTATGGTYAAGIGTGQESSCGPITITDSVTQVTANKGANAPNSIGKGQDGTCGTVTIGGVEYWKNSQYQNGGNDAQTGIVKSPYYYPIPNHTLDNIPSNWTVTANGQPVQVTPYASPNQDKGYAIVPLDADIVLIPADTALIKSVNLTDPLAIPLTFEAKTAGATVTFTKSPAQELSSLSVEYSTDGISWTNYTEPITLSDSGKKVSFRGTNATYAANRYTNGSHFSCSNDCYIYGNIMSLINKDNFATNTTLTADNTFLSLFHHNPLYNHPSKPLMLPATTLTPYCYMNMFNGCSNLTTAPALPATTLTPYCYSNMFVDCSSLTTAPVLPATDLAEFCYSDMFAKCSSLTTAPALPATTLTENCYANMFADCSSLTAAPALPATMLYLGCYWNMFYGCSSLTEAPALPATMLDGNCYASMFAGCSSLTAAPALPATNLHPHCYLNMFNGCSKLNSITCLATTFSETNCTENWISGVAATGTFTKAASADWSGKTGSGDIPSGWRTLSVVPGKFTVNATGGKVRFSAGNLQATTNNFGTTWTWAFATNQWDYIGNAAANTSINGNGTVSTNGTVDLFGWVGASSTWTGAAQYGISNETNTNSADTYGNEIGEALKSDWGNNIDSSWRTLTIDEWQYLFNTRASGSTVNGTSNARYTYATINGVNGIILFPDGVTIASGEATQWGAINGTSAWGTQCTSDQWTALVAKGCVFLPAAGDRINGTSISSAGSQGLYWSSTSSTTDSNPAYCIKFGSNSLNTNEFYYRFYGLSVRLVRDAN